jgi:hypothetical protein
MVCELQVCAAVVAELAVPLLLLARLSCPLLEYQPVHTQRFAAVDLDNHLLS